MTDWLIIGGGIHGIIIAQALKRVAGVPEHRIAIMDEHDEPLAVWRRTTANCGMEFLRSPAAHCLEPDYAGLTRFAREHGFDLAAHSVPPNARPSLELFNAYADWIVTGLGVAWITSRATAVAPDPRTAGLTVRTGAGDTMRAPRVVLATGRGAELVVPQWAREPEHDLQGSGGAGSSARRSASPGPGQTCPRIAHVFSEAFDREQFASAREPVIVGGGLTAAQLALSIARAGRSVTVLSPHPIFVHQYDSNPCYQGPKCFNLFLDASSPDGRHEVIQAARYPGSIPDDIAAALRQAISAGRIRYLQATAANVSERGSGLTLVLETSRKILADAVALATGFTGGPDRSGLLDGTRRAFARAGLDLPVDLRGFPVLRQDLSWSPGLYVAGPAAQTELGPSAPNIIGGHNAAKRIVSSLAGDIRMVPEPWFRYGAAGD